MIDWLQQGFGRVVEADGVTVALMGMSIVFLALAMISLFIAILPRALHAIAPLPEEDEEMLHAPARPAGANVPTPEVIAAIGIALHRQKSQGPKQ